MTNLNNPPPNDPLTVKGSDVLHHLCLVHTSFSLAPLICSTHFYVMCEQNHRNSFNPFLNGKKNGDFNGTCEQTLTINLLTQYERPFC